MLADHGDSRILFVFLDGVGLAEAGSSNPFSAAEMPFINDLLGGELNAERPEVCRDDLVFKQLDARLGVAGLPQSATGQTALLTGHNAAQLMGRHYGPWPGPTLKRVLDQDTIFHQAHQPCLANFFPAGYFEARARNKLKTNAFVYAAEQAGLSLKNSADYRRHHAISADLTGDYHHERQPDLPRMSSAQAGQRLGMIARDHDLTVFDFWISDGVGHQKDTAKAIHWLEQLDSFFAGIVEQLGDLTLVITSDHGNLEDCSVKTHTHNAVPLIVVGSQAGTFKECQSLLDVAPCMVQALIGKTAR